MSLIGTMYKEPRVFAHDAIALSALEYPINTIATVSIVSGGDNYTAAQVYNTATADGGSGAQVTATVVAAGAVTTATIAAGDGGINYQVGDILTLTGGGSDSDCVVQVATITATTTWSLGDPITPMPDNFNTVPYWNEKSSYTYTSTAVGNPGPHQTPGPGVGLYIGVAGDITVIMESGKEVVFLGVAAGTFLPISNYCSSISFVLKWL